MEEKEKISLELELITQKFSSKIKETTNKIKEFGQTAKEQFQIGKNIDISSAKSRLKELEDELIKLQSEQKKTSIYGGKFDTSQIDSVNMKIRNLKNDIEQAESGFGKLGQSGSKISSVMSSAITKIKNKMDELKKKTSTTSETIKNSFSKGIKSIKKFALSLFGVRTIFTAISRASSAYLSMNTELSDKLQSVWQGLGAQLAPVIEWLVNLFSKLLAIVNATVKALTGIDMVARANAKSLKKQASASKEASKSLSGIDEITNINTASGDSSNNSVPTIQLEPIDTTTFDKLKEILANIGEALKPIWDSAEATLNIFKKWTLNESFQTALNRVKTFIIDIWEYMKSVIAWANDMYQKYLLPVIQELLNFISDLIIAIGDIWNAIKPVVDKIWSAFKTIMEPVIAAVSGAVKGIIEALRGVLQFISGVFTGDWKKAWDGIKNIFKGIWDAIWSVLKGILNLILIGLETMINACIKGINKLFKPLMDVGNAVLKAVGIKNFSFSAIPQVSLPRLDVGTNYVPNDQLAMIHKGEAVIPKKFNNQEFFGSGNEEIIAKLDLVIDAINDKDMNTYLDGKAIGKTAQNYINTQSRIMGRSVI